VIELRGEKSVLKVRSTLYVKSIVGVIMHNLISYNQLAGWNESLMRLENTLDRSAEEADLINDYYNCLIECDDDQASCKRICRRILE
jgi:hypothetical protein